MSTPSLLLLTLHVPSVSHLSSFPLICPHWAGAAEELGRDSKLPVICNIHHSLYRLPLSATSPTNPPGPTQCEPGCSPALPMSLALCLPFLFLNQRSSLATLHAFSITTELGFLLEPLGRWQQHWAVSSVDCCGPNH